MTPAAGRRERPLFYIVEHKWDGYCQRFSKIGKWPDVLKWARDGSLDASEDVMAVYAVKRQPHKPTKRTRSTR